MNISFRKRLAYRQAVNTVLIAFLLGMFLSVIQIGYDFLKEQEQVDSTVTQLVGMLQGSAGQAVYNVDRLMIASVIEGLFEYQPICEAQIIDEFNETLDYKSRSTVKGRLTWIVNIVFGEKKSYTIKLYHKEAHQPVGSIKISVDSYQIAIHFIRRAGFILISGLIRNIVLSGVLIFFFYYSLTRPLLRMIKNVASVDPSQPATRLIETPHHHEEDEMGLLVHTTNLLLQGFEESLSKQRAVEEELRLHQEHLEQLVAERTSDLKNALEEQQQTNFQLNQALEQVEEANKEIMAGIRYATTIQKSLLPDFEEIKRYFSDSFFIWIPKEIVSGDIIFAEIFSVSGSGTEQRDNGLILAVADCTGHGVPGAFMTMIASTGLRGIIRDEGCRDPAEILKRLNFIVQTSLQQDTEHALSDDGLDIGICFIQLSVKTSEVPEISEVLPADSRQLTFAGAKFPLIYIQNGELNAIEGDKKSIGYKGSDLKFDFTNHTIPVTRGTCFYMCSDGLHDQLDETRSRKFGKKKVRNLLKDNSLFPFEKQEEILLEEFHKHKGDIERMDDVTAVGFRF